VVAATKPCSGSKDLCFRHLNLTLIQDQNADCPRLFIKLMIKYTKDAFACIDLPYPALLTKPKAISS